MVNEKPERKVKKPKMVEIKTELFSKPKKGDKYVITKAEEKDIDIGSGQMRLAISVEMKSTDKTDTKLYTESLWLADTASSTSKLGSFLVALGNDTEKWIGKTIKIREWSSRDREIEVMD